MSFKENGYKLETVNDLLGEKGISLNGKHVTVNVYLRRTQKGHDLITVKVANDKGEEVDVVDIWGTDDNGNYISYPSRWVKRAKE